MSKDGLRTIDAQYIHDRNFEKCTRITDDYMIDHFLKGDVLDFMLKIWNNTNADPVRLSFGCLPVLAHLSNESLLFNLPEKSAKTTTLFSFYVAESGLLLMLRRRSVLFIAPEGDRILGEVKFWNPSDSSGDDKASVLIEGWDGISRMSKVTSGSGPKQILNKSLSSLLATTGRRFPDLLKSLSYEFCHCWDTFFKNQGCRRVATYLKMIPKQESEQAFGTLLEDRLGWKMEDYYELFKS
ncbi:unnamed protein product [Didymodactylos carnosus]|uniref:Uncharacterized protein n=1 Tax=Didymodactylos carnosus TaxID=1234261 RepID=A0A815Q5A3_9BILA|nr:unnamed protein product [Didymodactylos carnosus]CAF4329506.1 unnamed protein product [Didymodactylos carnosus]